MGKPGCSQLSRHRALVLAASLAVFAISCGNGRKTVYPVTGRVVDADGKPAANAMVVFHPQDATDDAPTANPVGTVDDSGVFTLTTYEKDDGAPSGKYAVTITWPPARRSPFDTKGSDRLGGRYANPKTSTIVFTVEKQQANEVPTITVQ
jgi:hypothetical protein